MHSRGEVRSFLQSAAFYWLEEFHFDGLRFDAISNLLYWQGNKKRGENKSAIEFIRNLNSGLKEKFPDVMLIAEDSTAFPNVTNPVSEGGLGFDYKWDMGWMNDTLDYFRLSPQYRTEQYHKLTFSMMYFSSERFILPDHAPIPTTMRYPVKNTLRITFLRLFLGCFWLWKKYIFSDATF